MLRRTAAAAGVVLAVVLAPAAHADGPGGGLCEGAAMDVVVCAEDFSATTGTIPAGAGAGAGGGGGAKSGSSGPTCTYTRLEPQPPRCDNMFWKGHEREAGAVCGVTCPSSDREDGVHPGCRRRPRSR